MNTAIITLATNERYLQGAYNLYKSYLKTSSKYPFYCMIWPDVNINNYKDLPIIIIPKIMRKNRRFDVCSSPPVDVLSKICVWLLDQFDYVLFLDADIILYKNIDNIIETCEKNIENYNAILSFFNPSDSNYNWHRHVWNAIMFVKPNKNIFIKLLNYVDISLNDEELLTFAYDKKDIKIANVLKIQRNNLFRNTGIFHFDNLYKDKKYWETDLGNKTYESLLENPEIIKKLLK